MSYGLRGQVCQVGLSQWPVPLRSQAITGESGVTSSMSWVKWVTLLLCLCIWAVLLFLGFRTVAFNYYPDFEFMERLVVGLKVLLIAAIACYVVYGSTVFARAARVDERGALWAKLVGLGIFLCWTILICMLLGYAFWRTIKSFPLSVSALTLVAVMTLLSAQIAWHSSEHIQS